MTDERLLINRGAASAVDWVTHLAPLGVVALFVAVSGFEGWLVLYLLRQHRRLLLKFHALESMLAERGIMAHATIANPRGGAAAKAQPPPPPVPIVGTLTPPPDAAWAAIVEQLLAPASDTKPYEARPQSEYAWARRLGMHINRPPTTDHRTTADTGPPFTSVRYPPPGAARGPNPAPAPRGRHARPPPRA